MEELPSNFDVIVIGTGMPECIIAAAASRVGKSVLHLDRNGYYGGDWASFNFDQFLDWIKEKQNSDQRSESDENAALSEVELNDGEHIVPCLGESNIITSVCQKSYVRERPLPSSSVETQEPQEGSALSLHVEVEQSSNVGVPTDVPLSEAVEVGDISDIAVGPSQVPSGDFSVPEDSGSSEATPEIAASTQSSNDQVEDVAGAEANAPSSDSMQSHERNYPTVVTQQEWTVSSFRENRRKFNFDLAPKLLFSRGSLVELLISSNIARYADFQCVNRVLTFINGHIEQVPCSRADVFSTKNVTVVEKRMLMKLLTFCMSYQEQPEEYRGFEDRPFLEFLRSRKLTPNIEHYIIHAIAMVDEACSTLQGLEATQKFMQSLGRYGNSPFLWTCYGSAELPQCFCRLCAVFGGIYYLKRIAEGVIISDRCKAIISMGQRISCQWLVMESSFAPLEFLPEQTPEFISRAIFITDASLLPTERQQNTLLRLPPMHGLKNPVTVLEFSSKAYICPEDLYLVYMFCRSSNELPEEDLKAAAELLFKSENSDKPSGDVNDTKPGVLWCVYYKQKDMTTVNLNSRVPDGLLLTSSPDVEVDYEHAVKEAKDIFERICPGEEFLPRAPDPEDIILENHANPGEEGGKIENDVKDPEKSAPEELKNELDEQNLGNEGNVSQFMDSSECEIEYDTEKEA